MFVKITNQIVSELVKGFGRGTSRGKQSIRNLPAAQKL